MVLSPRPHPSQQNRVGQGGKVERVAGEYVAVTPPGQSCPVGPSRSMRGPVRVPRGEAEPGTLPALESPDSVSLDEDGGVGAPGFMTHPGSHLPQTS